MSRIVILCTCFIGIITFWGGCSQKKSDIPPPLPPKFGFKKINVKSDSILFFYKDNQNIYRAKVEMKPFDDFYSEASNYYLLWVKLRSPHAQGWYLQRDINGITKHLNRNYFGIIQLGDEPPNEGDLFDFVITEPQKDTIDKILKAHTANQTFLNPIGYIHYKAENVAVTLSKKYCWESESNLIEEVPDIGPVRMGKDAFFHGELTLGSSTYTDLYIDSGYSVSFDGSTPLLAPGSNPVRKNRPGFARQYKCLKTNTLNHLFTYSLNE